MLKKLRIYVGTDKAIEILGIEKIIIKKIKYRRL